jgi:hypothetical protein
MSKFNHICVVVAFAAAVAGLVAIKITEKPPLVCDGVTDLYARLKANPPAGIHFYALNEINHLNLVLSETPLTDEEIIDVQNKHAISPRKGTAFIFSAKSPSFETRNNLVMWGKVYASGDLEFLSKIEDAVSR